jgi:hypothetical protein
MERDQKHLSRLARGMRDSGVPPDRDLWPEIDATIDREEGRRSVRAGDQGIPWPRLIAVAAALTVVLAAGWAGVRTDLVGSGNDFGVGPVAQLTANDTHEDEGSGLDVIDNALDELNAALSSNPEDQNLTRLVLMIHQKRGNLLRRTTGNPGLN